MIDRARHILRSFPYLMSLLLTIVVVGFCYWMMGLYYEEGTDPYFKIISAGYYIGSPQPYFNLAIHNLLSFGYAALYKLNPNVAWYDWIMLSFTTLAGMLGFRTLMLLGQRLQPMGWLRWLVCIILSLLLIENLVLIQLTRTSFILAGSALLLIADARLTGDALNPHITLKMILLYLAVLLALLIRVEPPVLLVLFLGGALFLFRGFSYATLKESFRIMWPALAMIVLLGVWLRFPHIEADKFYNDIRPYTYTLWDYGVNPDELTLNDKKDSTLFYAAQQHFIADEQVFTPQAFNKIGLEPVDKSPQYWAAYLKRALMKLDMGKVEPSTQRSDYKRIVFILIFLALAHLIYTRHWKTHLFFIASLLAIWIFMKMEYRIIQPYLLFYALSCWLLLPVARKTGKSRVATAILLLIVLISGIGLAGNALSKTREHERMQRYLNRVMVQVECRYKKAYILPGLGLMEKLENHMFNGDWKPDYNRYASVDNGLLYLYPSEQQRMQDITGQRAFVDRIKHIAGKPDDFIWVGMASRVEVLQRTFTDLYGIPVEVIDRSDEISWLSYDQAPPIELKAVQFKLVSQ